MLRRRHHHLFRDSIRSRSLQSAMDKVELPSSSVKLPKNLRLLVIGASESGKSTFLANLIKHKETVFPEPYAKFIFCSPHFDSSYAGSRDQSYQKNLEEWSKPSEIVFYNKIIIKEELLEQADTAQPGRLLLIIDDFSEEITNHPLVYDLFSKFASHQSISSCIFLHMGLKSQNGNLASLLSQNCNYLVIFKSLMNRAAIGEMSKTIFYVLLMKLPKPVDNFLIYTKMLT